MWREQNGTDAGAVAVLGRLFVVKDARRRATSEKPMRAAQEHAQETGIRLVLDLMNKDAAAIKLYERLGLPRIGTTDHDHDNGHGDTIPAYCYVSPTRGPAHGPRPLCSDFPFLFKAPP